MKTTPYYRSSPLMMSVSSPLRMRRGGNSQAPMYWWLVGYAFVIGLAVGFVVSMIAVMVIDEVFDDMP
mgnify:CR=1 FL=1